jgi:Transcriptional regulator, AbiEi antitoxin, Type IV TA system
VKKLGSTLSAEASTALRKVLTGVPGITVEKVTLMSKVNSIHDFRPDILAEVKVAGEIWTLVAEVKAQASPKSMREQVKRYETSLRQSGLERVYPLLIAPWFSAEVVSLCAEAGVGTLDLEGNCRLTFGTVFIERTGHPAPPAQRREARALFAPKSARVLRVLLRDPNQVWKTEDLAAAAQVSLGHISNVRQELLERELAEKVVGGLRLTKPRKLLEAWQSEYKQPKAQRQGFYTLLHGNALEVGIARVLEAAQSSDQIVLAASSAARWIAPYLRTSSHFFYADGPGLQALTEALQLEPVSKGENIVVYLEPDEGVFTDRFEAAPGVWTTGLAQTYLDLAVSGERGLKAAQHLLETKIEPAWKGLS